MTVNQSNSHNSRSYLVLAVLAVFAIATFFFTRSATPTFTIPSPVSRLVSLRSMAQTSMPYEVALENGKPTLLEFYADWCTTCQAMAPELQQLHETLGETINFVMLNIDNPQWSSQVRQHKVNGIPQITILKADQSVAQTFVGKVPKTVLASAVGQLLE